MLLVSYPSLVSRSVQANRQTDVSKKLTYFHAAGKLNIHNGSESGSGNAKSTTLNLGLLKMLTYSESIGRIL